MECSKNEQMKMNLFIYQAYRLDYIQAEHFLKLENVKISHWKIHKSIKKCYTIETISWYWSAISFHSNTSPPILYIHTSVVSKPVANTRYLVYWYTRYTGIKTKQRSTACLRACFFLLYRVLIY